MSTKIKQRKTEKHIWKITKMYAKMDDNKHEIRIFKECKKCHALVYG